MTGNLTGNPTMAVISKALSVLLIAVLGYVWNQNDNKLDDLAKADSAITVKVDTNTAAIGDIKADIREISTAQTAIKEDVGEIKKQMEKAEQRQREDMQEIKQLIRDTNRSPP